MERFQRTVLTRLPWNASLPGATAVPTCRWQSGKRALFDIGGRSIVLETTGNQAKVSVTNRKIPNAPAQTRVRIVGCEVSIPDNHIKGELVMASPFFMEQYPLTKIIETAAELGALQALVQTGKLKPYLKKSEAFRLYGRKNVERWLDRGLLTIRKDGNHSACLRLDRLELELIVKTRFLLQHI